MRKTLAVVCMLGLLAWAGSAQAADNTWTNGADGNWATGTWSDGTPTADDNCFADGTTAYTITVNTAGAVCRNIDIGYAGTEANPCTLSLQANGDLSVTICVEAQNGGYGLFEQTGGTSHISGLRIGRYGQVGKVEISGGTMLPYYREHWTAPDPPDQPVYLGIGDAGTRVGYQSNRQGAFEVIGAGSSIKVLGGESSSRVGYEQSGYGTLIANLVAGNITTIVVDTSVSASLINAAGDDAHFDYTDSAYPVIDITGTAPTVGTSLTLLTADYIDDEGVVLDATDLDGGADWGANYWTLTVTAGTATALGAANNTDNGSVVVTYVPEPATLSLLALGGIALIRRRRR